MTFVYTPFVLNFIPAPIMQPVSKHRRIDIESEPDTQTRVRTRAESIRQWQATARHEYHQSDYGRNPFRVGDEVEIFGSARLSGSGAQVWIRGTVTRVAGRFEHYAVHVQAEYDGVLGRVTIDARRFAFSEIQLYDPCRARTLKID